MLIARQIAAQARRHRPEASFPPVGYDEGIFFLEDTEKQSYLGACFIGTPLAGIDPSVMEKFRSVMSGNFPGNTFAQMQLLSVPDIDADVERYLQPKIDACSLNPNIPESQRALLRQAVEHRAEFFLKGKAIPHIPSNGVRNHRVIQIASIKFPTSSRPTDKEVQDVTEMIAKFEQGLMTTGFDVQRCDAGAYQSILRYLFDPWAPQDFYYDDEQEIREQVLPKGFSIDYTNAKNMVFNEDTNVRVLSINRMPKRGSIGLMNMVSGDPSGINNQFPIPWLATLTIRFPDQQKKKKWFAQRHGLITMQAQGQVARFVPRLRLKKQAFDEMAMGMEEGNNATVEASFNITMYSRDERELAKLTAQMSTYMDGFGLNLQEDSEILWPIFWNNLPLFPSDTSIENLYRFRTMSLRAAIRFAPMLCDWTGTGTAAMLLETRRGQPFGYDLYDSPTNYNALVFAEPGAGKSVFLNSLITDYLALGSRVWVTDIGRSYYKQAKLLGGEFWSFSEDSDICLNPFSFVVDIDDEMDMLKALLAKMAAPADGLNDYQMARLQEAIKAVWGRMGKHMTVTEVAEYMCGMEDKRVQDIGDMLFPFTRNGQFGHWFDGEANLKFNSNFIVLELEELGQKEHLQQVVLMILMSQIQYEMFLGQSNGQKKFAIFDEAWALFADPGVARFLNHGYRRFRKYEGSAIVAVHSLSDFYLHPQMEAVAQNAATRFILQQMPESIDAVVNSGKLALDDFGRAQLKSVQSVPGQYSEIMIHTGRAYALTRLTLPRFAQVQYSTKGAERDLIIRAIEQGMPADVAINQYIKERG